MLDVVIGESLSDKTIISLKDTTTINLNKNGDKYNCENYTLCRLMK